MALIGYKQSLMVMKQIDQCVEALCQKGCGAVREDIKLLKQGVILPEMSALDDRARKAVLDELCSIMAVYGDRCPIPPLQQKKQSTG